MRPPAALVHRSAPRLLLELDLSRGLQEAPPASPLEAVRGMHVPTLRGVVEALRRAARDARVVGVVAHVGAHQPTLAQSGELREAVAVVRAAGKHTVCWTESFGELVPGNTGYHVATAFEEVWLQPSGDVGLVGFSAQALFVREALDKLGVEVQLGQRHEYKTAADVFLRSSLSEPHREMLARVVESATDTVVRDVAASRGLAETDVRAVLDTAPVSAQDALDLGLVDRLGYRDEVYADLRTRFGDVQLRYVERYGRSPLAQARAAVTERGRPVVAVVHAAGPIHLGRSRSTPLSGRSIGSDSLTAALRAAGSDDDVRAVVLRIDSPGGSYAASDAVRREVLALREAGRPVVASMASVAASGGYFIAMPADSVVANAGTITGSIGVLGGKQVVRDALQRIGVRREDVPAGPHADMSSTNRPFDDEEWQRLEGWLDRVYDDFTTKAAQDRGLPVEELRAVARGRVWSGADAAERGLVDELGGLERAVDLAARAAGLGRDDVEVRVVPRTTLLDRLRPAENSESPAAAAVSGTVALLTDRSVSLPEQLLAATGLAPYGVLSLPGGWRLT